VSTGLPASSLIRRATVDDAQAIATVHVQSWQTSYRDILPKPILDGLNVERRIERWRQTLADATRATFVAVDESIGSVMPA
jgi:hypothetical protein